MFKINIRVILFAISIVGLILCSVVLATWYFIIYPTQITQGGGSITSEKRNLSKFSKINVSDKIILNLTQGTQEVGAEVQAETNIIKNIRTEVVGDTLNISFIRNGILNLQTINPTKEVIVNLNYQDLNSLNISGNVILNSKNKSRIDDLTISQTGDTKVNLDTFANSLNLNISGNANLTLGGSVTKQEISISGSAKLMAGDLDSKEAKINLSGSSFAQITADDSLEINSSGSASLEYKGNPKKLTQNITGTGTVKHN